MAGQPVAQQGVGLDGDRLVARKPSHRGKRQLGSEDPVLTPAKPARASPRPMASPRTRCPTPTVPAVK